MFLFGRRREKPLAGHTKCPAERNASAALRAAEDFIADHRNGVKVLGTDTASCAALKETVDDVLAQLSPAEHSEYIGDVYKIAAYGVMHTPALVIDGQVVCTGRVPSKNEIASFIKKRR
ncbi:thioredoxin family protein [Treponema sp.]|uniref:thioredoxin family protein n=1 Tax=Treponema sp. TaxID=166 RepID=UPI003FA23719